MIKTIKRFPISIEPTQKLKIPFNSEILSFDMINGEPGINAIVEDGQTAGERTLFITTLGKELPQTINKTRFIGKFLLPDQTNPAHVNILFVFES